MDNLLEVKNIGLKYGKGKRKSGFRSGSKEFWALTDISFDLQKGDVLGIIGRNGSGKSTLMSLLARIIDPDRGEISRKYKSALLLSLQAGFMNYLSGRKNIYLSGLLIGYTYKQLKKLENQIIEFAGLEDFIDEPVVTYSSGMRARLGFSVCVHLEPDLILIDEVLGVGDRDFKIKSKKALTEKIKRSTAIIVSHDETTLGELCNKLLIINKGESVFFGPIKDGLSFYSSMF